MTQTAPLTDAGLDVLVVESDPAIAESLVLLFETANLKALAELRPERVVDLVTSQSPGCLVVAQDLAGDTGIALLTRLRANGIQAPVIILASQSDVRLAVAAMRAGATDFLVKPLTDSRLLQGVRDLLRTAGKSRQAMAP